MMELTKKEKINILNRRIKILKKEIFEEFRDAKRNIKTDLYNTARVALDDVLVKINSLNELGKELSQI